MGLYDTLLKIKGIASKFAVSSEWGERRQVLQPGQQWASRRHLTAFVRAVRTMLDEVGGRRGRPFILSARCALSLGGQAARGRLAASYLLLLFLLLSRTDLIPNYSVHGH